MELAIFIHSDSLTLLLHGLNENCVEFLQGQCSFFLLPIKIIIHQKNRQHPKEGYYFFVFLVHVLKIQENLSVPSGLYSTEIT